MCTSKEFEDYAKCVKIMRSCQTIDQLEVAFMVNSNFHKKWKNCHLLKKLNEYFDKKFKQLC